MATTTPSPGEQHPQTSDAPAPPRLPSMPSGGYDDECPHDCRCGGQGCSGGNPWAKDRWR